MINLLFCKKTIWYFYAKITGNLFVHFKLLLLSYSVQDIFIDRKI